MIHFRVFVVEQVMITFRVRGSRGELCSGYGRLCLSVPRRIPTLLNRPECKFGNGRGCPLVVHFVSDIAIFVLKRDVKLQLTNLVVHYSADLQSVHVLRGMSASACTRSVLYTRVY